MERNFRIIVALIASLMTAGAAQAQQYYWSNFAGKPGSSGSGDGTGSAAQFNAPYATAIDGGGNVYVADSSNHTIRKMTLSGTSWVVTTLAGNPGVSGTADGTGNAAQFNIPTGVAVDSGNNVYVADSGNMTIRKVTPGGAVTTLAGTPGQSGFADATGGAAIFGSPSGLAVDSARNVYVADLPNHVIRKVTSGGVVTTFAGTPGQSGYADGPGNAALFNSPTGVAVDGSGNVYVADNLNHVIRKITSGGVVTTLAGTPVLYGTYDGTGSAATFNYPASVAVDSGGNVYVADTCNHVIRKVTAAGTVTTLAGTVINRTHAFIPSSGTPGFKDGAGSAALFDYPYGVGVDGAGNVYVADTANNAIRKVSVSGFVTTIGGSPNLSGNTNGTASAAQFNNPNGIAVGSGGNLYVADTNNHTIRQVTSAAVVTTLAGKGTADSTDGTGTGAYFNFPYGAAADNGGHVYVADTFNNTIRQITLSGSAVVTISGSAGAVGTTDGDGYAARFNNPTGIAVDGGGNVYVADSYNNTIRKITVSGTVGTVTTISGSAGVSGTSDGPGNAALFSCPTGVAVDGGTNIYVADSSNCTIRKITLSGTGWVTTTLAGTPGVSGRADGPGNAAQFGCPNGIAVDSGSNVYVADSGNCTIRRITPSGVVTTIGGLPGVVGATSGIGSAGLFAYPYALAVDGSGNVFVADSGNNRISIGSCVGSGSASGITGTGATLNGQADPNGMTTSVYFQYGTTTAYGTVTSTQAVGSGTNFVPVTATLSGLTANTTYHYQLVVVNASGTFYGSDQMFVTPPTAIPSITSATTATGTNGLAFSYQTVASNSPTGYGASPLPTGLIVDPSTGQIVGTPTLTGTTNVTLSATNVVGTATITLTLKIVDVPIPSITSGTTASGVLGFPFNYQITATNSPTSFSATGLPTGLTVNSVTGFISGIPSQFGAFAATIGAINSSGTGTITLALTVTPSYYWSNFAGKPGTFGTADGSGANAMFHSPRSLTVDGGGNVYVADNANHAVRKITSAGVVTTLAGTSGTFGATDGPGGVAQFKNPGGIIVDSGSNIYVADTNNNTIRKLTFSGTSWVVTTVAGTAGTSGSTNATGTAARFNAPWGLAMDSGSNIYIADRSNNTIRKMTPAGVVTTLAGTSGTYGTSDGTGGAARFWNPSSVAVDSANNVYVADCSNYTIRKITSAGVVTTIAGKAGFTGSTDGIGGVALFNFPWGITVDGNGNLYVLENMNDTVRKMTLSGTSWMVTTIGGSPGVSGTSDGIGSVARFSSPTDGIATDSGGNIYVADTNNHRISKGILLSPPVITSPLTATLTSGSAFSYQITASNTPASYNATGLPPGLSVNLSTGLISGIATVSGTSTISATNPAGTGTAKLVLTVVTPYSLWKTQRFTSSELLDPSISGNSATPSGDGIANLIKYALGLYPEIHYSGSAVLPYAQQQTIAGTNYLTLTFTRDTDATDVNYSVEAANDLSGVWTEIDPLAPANQVSVLPDTPAPGIQTITVKDGQPANASARRFMRLRLTIP